jgi:hypothetical protein
MNRNDRYKIERLPITKKTYEGLSQDGINLIGAIGRMLKIQDDYLDERFDQLFLRLDAIDTKLESHDLRIDCLERKVEQLEKKIA